MKVKVFFISILVLIFFGCSKPEPRPVQIINKTVVENQVPGTVNVVWEEDMHDTVRVPAQLDPAGTYYRKSHQTIYQIREGRYQERQFPADSADVNNAKKVLKVR